MPETLTAVCGAEIRPGDEYLEFDDRVYCKCWDCMNELFHRHSQIHEYDPAGDAADLEYDSHREEQLLERGA